FEVSHGDCSDHIGLQYAALVAISFWLEGCIYVLELKKTLNSATCGCKLVAKPEKRRGKALWAEESDDGPPFKERVRYRRYAQRKGKPCREKIQRERGRGCVSCLLLLSSLTPTIRLLEQIGTDRERERRRE
ncbi:hypothetical protein CPAR01_09078, partial [Colletotrichum paranaense]